MRNADNSFVPILRFLSIRDDPPRKKVSFGFYLLPALFDVGMQASSATVVPYLGLGIVAAGLLYGYVIAFIAIDM